MTPVGHSLFGATVAFAGSPPAARRPPSTPLVLAAIVCANLPDLPLPGWGHSNYRFSHSLFVGLSLMGAMGLLYVLPGVRTRLGGWRAYFVCAAALLSHYLLDSFYNHGRGIAMFWPFSDARLALPIPWFSTLGSMTPAFDWHLLRTCTIELISYGGLLGVVWWLRRVFTGSSRPKPLAAD